MGESLVIMRFGKVMTDTVYVLMRHVLWVDENDEGHYDKQIVAIYRNKFPIDKRLMVAIGCPDADLSDYFLITRTIYTMPY